MQQRTTNGGARQQNLRSRPTAVTLSSLNIDATRQQFELEALLHPEMRNEQTPLKRDEDGFSEIKLKLNEFTKTLGHMNNLLDTERIPGHERAIWSKRLHGYRQRSEEFIRTLETKQQRSQRAFQQQERDNLFGDRDGAQVLNMINDFHEERESLNRSSRIAGDAIAQGISVIENLQRQGSTLRKAQERLKEIANTLGLSSSLLRVIDRREKGDAMIVYGGMVFTVVFLYFVYSYTR